MKTAILFLSSILTLSAQVQVSVTEPFPRTRPNEGFSQLTGALGTASSSAGNVTNVDLSYDGGAYNATFGPATVGPARSVNWSVLIDARTLTEGLHTIRARATDAQSNVGYSPVVAFNVLHTNPICSHTQVGPDGTGIFCERAAVNVGANPSAVTFPGGYTAGQTIIVETSMGASAVYETQLNWAIDKSQTTLLMVGPCSNFKTPPFDFKVNQHPTYANFGQVEKMRVTACTGSTATVTRGVAGNDCVLSNGELGACSAAIAHDANAIVNVWGDQTPAASNITNTNGYTWTAIKRVSSGPFGDHDNAQGAIWMTVVPSTTMTSDTITFNDSLSNFSITQAIIYSGIGALEAGSVYATHVGGPGGLNSVTGPYPSAPGDLNLALVGGAPTTPVPTSPVTSVRSQDPVRPYAMFVDQYSTATTADIGTYMNSEGASVVGMAFRPAGSSPTVQRTVIPRRPAKH